MLAQGSCWKGGGRGEGQAGPTAAERGNCRLRGLSTLTRCWEIKALESGQMGPVPLHQLLAVFLVSSHSSLSLTQVAHLLGS